MENQKTKRLVESAIMLTLATILSVLKIVELPAGGSITIASMLPIVIIAYRYGTAWGLGIGLIYGVIQQLFGLDNLSYFTTWQSIVAVILLDYIIAFAVIGLSGIFRNKIKNQATAMMLGALLVCILRYICHVLSGATVWKGLSIPTSAALTYSVIYNATYMIPETIVLLVATCYIGSVLDFRAELPVRFKPNQQKTVLPWIPVVSGLLIAAATIFDTASVFAHLSNTDGYFDITQISEVNWVYVIAVTGVTVVISAVLLIIRQQQIRKTITSENQ